MENKIPLKNEFRIKRSQLNLIKYDVIVPPKQILSYKIQFKTRTDKRILNFTLGINNIVIHEWFDKTYVFIPNYIITGITFLIQSLFNNQFLTLWDRLFYYMDEIN